MGFEWIGVFERRYRQGVGKRWHELDPLEIRVSSRLLASPRVHARSSTLESILLRVDLRSEQVRRKLPAGGKRLRCRTFAEPKGFEGFRAVRRVHVLRRKRCAR